MLRKLCISVVLNGIYSDRPQEPDLCTSTIERKQYLFERTYVKKCSLCMLLLLNRSFHGFSTFYKEQLAKITRQHSWKVKLPNLKSDLLKTNELSKVAELYRRLYGEGHELVPHHTNVSTFWINIFTLFGRTNFKLCKLLMDIRLLLFIKI